MTVSSERSVNSKTIQKKFKMGDTTGWGRGEREREEKHTPTCTKGIK